MKRRIIIHVPRKRMKSPSEFSGVVRVTPEAESIIRRYVRETGMPIRWVASRIIERAADDIDFDFEEV